MNGNNMSRIDYLLCTQHIAKKATSVIIAPAPTPDHQAVIACFSLQERKRGRGYWKLNTSILKDVEYKHEVSSIIKNTIAEYSNVPAHKRYIWDLIKIKIKEFSIKYCIIKKRKRVSRIAEIENRILAIDTELYEDANNTYLNERCMLKTELDSLLTEKAYGAQVRSRARWIEEGEKSTSYFLSLEKAHQTSNRIDVLKDKDNTFTTDNDILAHARDFYLELYHTRNPDKDTISQYLSTIHFDKTLTEDSKTLCEGIVIQSECFEALNSMKDNKSPGLDGLPAEFYKTFWPDISEFLIDVYNESFKLGELAPSQRESVLSLIFKKGDSELINNYRPISLTNSDYKLLAFTLSNRLQKVIGEIVHTDQSGYIKNRFIGNNIRTIQDIMEYAERTDNKEAVLMLIDFKKAFDSVEWEFMFQTLSTFNFGPEFIAWIKTLYSNPKSVIKNNGWMSSEFDVSRGIKQGCPISALLFILVVEIMGLKLRQDTELKGLHVTTIDGIREVKTQQYADDTCLILKNVAQIPRAIAIISEFGDNSGLELNLMKTEVMFLNSKANHINNEIHDIKWTIGPVKCLGIYIGHNRKACEKLNWEDKMIKMQNTLRKWGKRDLTLFGKTLIIKTLVMSQIIFSATNTVTPANISKQIDSLIFSFLWGKRDRIQRKVLYAPVELGGLNMIDVASQLDALKAAWFDRITADDSTSNWSIFGNKYINTLGGKAVCRSFSFSSLEQLPQLNNIPEFYRQVFLAFAKANTCSKATPENRAEALTMSLWGNDLLLTEQGRPNKKQCLLFPNWIHSGIMTPKDLKIDKGQIDTNYILNRIRCQQNILCELIIMRRLLKPYLLLITDNNPDGDINNEHNQSTYIVSKSREYYKRFVKNKIQTPWLERKWCDELEYPDPFPSSTYVDKIKNVKDNKIAEFNFKVLHFILPCNKHLKTWRIIDCDKCDVCGEVQDLKHLLYLCRRNRETWHVIETTLQTTLTLKDIIWGRNNCMFNWVTSLVAFIMYKEWIVCKNEEKNRSDNNLKRFIKAELKYKIDVYSKIDRLKQITDRLKDIVLVL